MHPIIRQIQTRRSIRSYRPDPIAPGLLEDLLQAAMYAPSARNQQPWHFIVVNQREALDALAEANPYAKMLYQAPVAILVCAEPKRCTSPQYWQQDCAAATENILLAAHGVGLGTCWCGLYPAEERCDACREILNIPADIIPLSLIALGYPAEEKDLPERFQPERIHYNCW